MDEPWCMDTVYDIKQQEVPTTKGVICLESSQEAYFFQIIISLGYLAAWQNRGKMHSDHLVWQASLTLATSRISFLTWPANTFFSLASFVCKEDVKYVWEKKPKQWISSVQLWEGSDNLHVRSMRIYKRSRYKIHRIDMKVIRACPGDLSLLQQTNTAPQDCDCLIITFERTALIENGNSVASPLHFHSALQSSECSFTKELTRVKSIKSQKQLQ